MGQGQSQPEAVQSRTEGQAEGVPAASQEKQQAVDRPAAPAETTQSEIRAAEPEQPQTGPTVGTTAAQGTKTQSEPVSADLPAVHDNPVFETDPLADETEPVAEPRLPAEPASSKATTLSPEGGSSYATIPADEFHDAPDDFAVDSHPIGDLQDSDSVVSGLASGDGAALEGPGLPAKEPHDAGGEIKADNPVEETNGIPPTTVATPTSATDGVKSKATEDDKVPGGGCFNCFSTGKAPSKKAPKKSSQAGKAPAAAATAAVPAAAAATAGGIAVAGSTREGDPEPEVAATPAAQEEPLSTEALPGAVQVQYTDEGPDKALPTTSAQPEEGGAAAAVAEPPIESADKGILTDSATDAPALENSTPAEPAALESQEPPPSRIPKPQPMYTSYHLDDPDTTAAATAEEPMEAVAEEKGLTEPVAEESGLAEPVAEEQSLAEPVADERDLGAAEPAVAVADEPLPVVDERSELQLEDPAPGATGEVHPTPQKEAPLESMQTSGEMTPLTKIQHAHHAIDEEEPASEEAGYGGHNELLEPMSSYDYEDAATAAASHPVEYESDVMARHDDILEPQAGSGGEPVEAVGAAEAQPNEATGAPDGHAAEIAAGSALAAGAAAGAVAATAAAHDKDAMVQTKQDAGEATAVPVTAAQTKAADKQKSKEAKALEKRKAREEAEKQKLAKKAANKKKGGRGGGLFGCFTGSAAAGAAGTAGAAGAAKDTASGAAGTGSSAAPQAAPTAVAPVSASPDAGAIAGATAAGLAVGGAVGAGAVAYSTPFASPKKEGDEVEAPLTPATTEAAPPAGAVVAVADTPPAKPGKPPKRSKSGRVDYSAIHMAKSPSARLREGYNPSTGLYDTPAAARTPPGAYSPLRASQPKLQSTVELARQASMQRRVNVDRTPMQDRVRVPSARRLSADGTPIGRAPPGKGIDRAEVSNNYRPLSTVYS